MPYDGNAPKKAVNLSINSDLLREARELGLNLSRTLEKTLEQAVKAERLRKRQEELRPIYESQNAHFAKVGYISDEWNNL